LKVSLSVSQMHAMRTPICASKRTTSDLDGGVTRTVHGLVLIQAPPFTDFCHGDRVRAEGRLQTPTNTGDFDYREYLARQNVYSIMSRPRVSVLVRDQGFAPLGWLYSFKARAKNVIAQTLRVPGPQASLLTGILGDDAGVPKSLQEAFRITGTFYILAVHV
jgi:predicted membrane metal-binding protein